MSAINKAILQQIGKPPVNTRMGKIDVLERRLRQGICMTANGREIYAFDEYLYYRADVFKDGSDKPSDCRPIQYLPIHSAYLAFEECSNEEIDQLFEDHLYSGLNAALINSDRDTSRAYWTDINHKLRRYVSGELSLKKAKVSEFFEDSASSEPVKTGENDYFTIVGSLIFSSNDFFTKGANINEVAVLVSAEYHKDGAEIAQSSVYIPLTSINAMGMVIDRGPVLDLI